MTTTVLLLLGLFKVSLGELHLFYDDNSPADRDSCAIQPSASSEKLSRYWASNWSLTSRMVNTSQTCRASCHLLRVCMHVRLINRRTSLETCSSMISSLEVNGPSAFCDASAQFLHILIDHLQGQNIPSKDIAERILTWLFRSWAPSESAISPATVDR